MRDIIPKDFYHGDDHPTCETVGELINELNRLPKELEVRLGFGSMAKLVVFNINTDTHLSIEED